MKILKDLLFETDKNKIKKEIILNYPGEKITSEKYDKVFEELSNLIPSENIEKMKLTPILEDEMNGKKIWGISAVYEGDIINYAIDFMEWEEILGAFVYNEDLNEITVEEFLAHILYDLTWNQTNIINS